MLNNSKLSILLIIISINNIYNCNSKYFKTIHISNKEFLFINKYGIYLLNENKMEEKYNFEKNNEKFLMNEKIENIYYYKSIDIEDIILIFIKNYIYIFNYRGDFIRKCKSFSEFPTDKHYILPYKYNSQHYYKYNYIFLYISNQKNSIVLYIYEYNYILNISNFLFKDEIYLPNLSSEKNALNNNYFLYNLMLGKSNKTLLTILYKTNYKNNNFLFETFEINIEENFVNNYNKNHKIKPILKTKIGTNIQFINNVDNTKALVCSKNKNLINCFIYDSIKNEIINNINYLNNSISELNCGFEFIIDKINHKYVLYSFSSQGTINIIELNEYFQYESSNIYKINNKMINSGLYHLIYNTKNYQLLLFSNKNQFQILTSIQLIENNNIKNLRLLNEGDNVQNNENNNNENQPSPGSQNIPDNENDRQEESNSSNIKENENGNENENNNISGNQDNNNGEKEEENNESKGNGQTKGGFDFDFDNKETNIPKDKIRDNRDDLMSNIKPGESYDLKGDGYEIKVAPMGQKEEGSTSIDFLSCEKKLRDYYNLSDSDILTVFQTESETSSDRTLTNKVQYVVYDENNTQLDLSVCSDEQIRINYALKENSTLNISMFSNFYEKGIDILNSSDSFFNDICYTYSDGGSDMILSDRIAEIYQNYSLCDSGCDYEGLDPENLTVSCSCSVITNDTEDDDDDEEANIKEIVLNLFEDSTFGVVKCYKLVFSTTNKKKNIGFWVFLIIIIVHIPLYVLFFKNGIFPIKKYIENEMQKYNYWDKSNASNPPRKSENNAENSEKNKNTKNIYNEELKSDNINFVKNTNESMNREENEYTDKKINIILSDIVPENQNLQKVKLSTNIPKSNELIETEYNTKREETNNDIVNIYNKDKDEKNKPNAYYLIKKDANNTEKNSIPPESNYILNNYEYDTALKYDNRTFWRILYIVMLSKDNVLNTFILKSPLESQPLRICLLIFAYASDLALNTLFYFSDNISDKYHYSGDNLFWFTILNNILISVISTVLSLVLGSILQLMTDSKSSIENEFKKEEKKMRKDENYYVTNERKEEIMTIIKRSLRCLKLKMVIFVIIDFLILLFFFYFVSSFCEVYQNTQISWISDAVVSIIISFPIELAISLAITIVYKLSLKYQWESLYKLVMLLV